MAQKNRYWVIKSIIYNSCSDAGTRKSQCLINEVDHPGRIFVYGEVIFGKIDGM